MALVASLASRVARVAMIAPAIARIKQKVVRMVIGGLLLAVLGLLGAIYLLTAVRVELEHLLGPLWPPLILGVLFCLLAAVSYLMFLRPRRSEERAAKADKKNILAKFMRPARDLEGKIGSRPWLSIGASLGAGFAAAYLLSLLRSGRRSGRSGDDVETYPSWASQELGRENERRKSNSGWPR